MITTFAEEAVGVVFWLVLWVVTDGSDTASERRATDAHREQSGSESVANYRKELRAVRAN